MTCFWQRSTTRTILALVVFALLAFGSQDARAQARSVPTGAFAFEVETVVPGAPDVVWDAFTRETIAWWDHTFSDSPKSLTIEAKPGGGFVEIFDDQGNGVVHARVTYADRGKKLRLVGPLGLADHAIDLVCTLSFTAVEGGTKLGLSVHAAGEVHEGWPKVVEGVWRHFLIERFLPYMRDHAKAAPAPRAP